MQRKHAALYSRRATHSVSPSEGRKEGEEEDFHPSETSFSSLIFQVQGLANVATARKSAAFHRFRAFCLPKSFMSLLQNHAIFMSRMLRVFVSPLAKSPSRRGEQKCSLSPSGDGNKQFRHLDGTCLLEFPAMETI